MNYGSEIKANIVYKSCYYQSLQYELKWNLKKHQFAVFHHQHFCFETKVYIYIQASSSVFALKKASGIGRIMNTAIKLSY